MDYGRRLAIALVVILVLAGCQSAPPEPGSTGGATKTGAATTTTRSATTTSAPAPANVTGSGGPNISQVRVTAVTHNSATVAWLVGTGAAVSWADYGKMSEPEYETSTTTFTGPGQKSAMISKLLPDTAYRYRISARDDKFHFSYSVEGNFTTKPDPAAPTPTTTTATTTTSSSSSQAYTPPPQDTTTQPAQDPALTVSGVTASDVTTSGFKVSWNVGGPATGTTSKVQYGTTTTYGSDGTAQDGTGAKSFTLTGLAAGTTYHFRIMATSGTQSQFSQDLTQQTTAAEPTLEISGTPVVSDVTTTSFKVSWTVNGPSSGTTSKVKYGTTSAYGSEALGMPGTGSRFATITGLTQGTLYHFKVVAASGSQTDDDGPDQEQRTAKAVTFDIISQNTAPYFTQSPMGALTSPLKITVTNSHTNPHTWAVEGVAGTTTPTISSGGTYEFPDAISFSPATYTYKCTIHPSMTGTFTIA